MVKKKAKQSEQKIEKRYKKVSWRERKGRKEDIYSLTEKINKNSQHINLLQGIIISRLKSYINGK